MNLCNLSSQEGAIMKLLVCMILILASILSAGQVVNADLYSRVPEQHRARLKVRLDLYIASYRNHDWGKVFDLRYRPRMKKKSFIKRESRSTPALNRETIFQPRSISAIDLSPEMVGVQGYGIYACVKPPTSAGTVHSLYAYLVNGEWYFGEIYPTHLAQGGEPIPCEINP